MIIGSVATMTPGSAPSPTPPIANFDWTPRDPSMGALVQFTDQSLQNPTSWSWTRNGVQFSMQQNPSLYFSLPGAYTIALTATNSFGSSTASAIIYVSAEQTNNPSAP